MTQSKQNYCCCTICPRDCQICAFCNSSNVVSDNRYYAGTSHQSPELTEKLPWRKNLKELVEKFPTQLENALDSAWLQGFEDKGELPEGWEKEFDKEFQVRTVEYHPNSKIKTGEEFGGCDECLLSPKKLKSFIKSLLSRELQQPDKGELPENWEKEIQTGYEKLIAIIHEAHDNGLIFGRLYKKFGDNFNKIIRNLSRELPPAIGVLQVIEMVEKMKKVHKEFECNGKYEDWCEDKNCPSRNNQRIIGFNQALDEVISKLKK
ncbi:MAG: hypothetical protein AAB922_01425 [Patescibacteria group bacterium]